MQRDFTTVGLQSGRAEVLDLIRARAIRQVPIVDSAGRPIGLHLLQELIGAKVRPNWGVIMAGGKGTRLRPLTEAVPKPMLKVAGRPILERLILHMVGYGIRRIFLSINYLGHIIEQYFGDGARFGCQIEYLREERPLGTAGSLSLLPEAPTEPILVMNGDLVTQTNLGDMLDYHLLGPQVATMGVRRYVHTIPFGCVELEGERVISLVEKPQVERMVNTGIYVLDPKVVARIPRQQECTVPGLLDDCLARNERVYAYELRDDWIDVGQFHQLHQAQSGEGDLPPVEAVVAAPVKQAA
jgi:NDP-sugar pyrophosphorylase family protein